MAVNHAIMLLGLFFSSHECSLWLMRWCLHAAVFNTSRGEWGVIGGNRPLDLTSYQLNQIEFNGIEAEQRHEWQPWPEPKFSMLKAYTSDALPAQAARAFSWSENRGMHFSVSQHWILVFHMSDEGRFSSSALYFYNQLIRFWEYIQTHSQTTCFGPIALAAFPQKVVPWAYVGMPQLVCQHILCLWNFFWFFFDGLPWKAVLVPLMCVWIVIVRKLSVRYKVAFPRNNMEFCFSSHMHVKGETRVAQLACAGNHQIIASFQHMQFQKLRQWIAAITSPLASNAIMFTSTLAMVQLFVL